jgi:hypothetical protein
MATIYRNPVPGQALPLPLACLGTECTTVRGRESNFICPNHERPRRAISQSAAALRTSREPCEAP